MGPAYRIVAVYRWRSFASVWRSVASCSRHRINSCFADLSSLLSASMTSRLPWHAQLHVTDVISGVAVTLRRSEPWLAENESRASLSRWKPTQQWYKRLARISTYSYSYKAFPLTPTVTTYHMGTAIKHSVLPDQVKPSFVVFDIWALWRSGMSVRVPRCQKYKLRFNQVRHRMHYSCTISWQQGVKGLTMITFLTRKL